MDVLEFQILYFSIVSVVMVVLTVILEWLHSFNKVSAENTRLIFQAFTCGITPLFPIIPDIQVSVFFVCLFFSGMWVFLKYKGWFSSLLDVKHRTIGFPLFPLGIFFVYCIWGYGSSSYLLMYLPIVLLGTSDVLASAIGRAIPYGKYSVFGATKTLSGSLVVFMSAFIISYLGIFFTKSIEPQTLLLAALGIAAVTAVVEGISSYGFDNITVPVSAAVMIYVLESIS